jgi:hypothetical protein
MKAETTAQNCFDTLMAATVADDYSRFVSIGDQSFRDAITNEMFQAVSDALAPRMRSGCTSTYLGRLRQGQADVSLWQLAFADGGDDALARLAMTSGTVNGFLITPAFG